MKKGFLIFLMGIVSFLGINTVSADTIVVSNWYDEFEQYIEDYNQYKENIDYMINYWKENYSDDYPYYVIVEKLDGFYTHSTQPGFILGATDDINSFYNDIDLYINADIHISYDPDSNEYSYGNPQENPYIVSLRWIKNSDFFSEYHVLINNGIYSHNYYNFLIPSYTSETLGITIPEIELTKDSLYPGLIDLYNGSYLSDSMTSYKEIDLNQYSYVALSLKDYNNIPENNSSVYTNIWTKGQLCITPVYNYGMTERKDILTGTQVQRCSSYYNDFTSIRMYLLKTDVENHSIYYLKAYDTSKENIVKVDTSVFDITYITEDTKDNPYVSIGGKQYPTIAYDKLTDTATKSEDDDYNSGVSCPVGDLNCYNEYNSENIFDSVFDSPLKILKNIWSSITSVFDIITEFIMLLPEAMQSFLFLSFMIAIILGLIKIIL